MRPKCTSSTSHPFDATELTLADIRPTQRHVIDKHVSFLPHPLLHLHPPSSMAPPPRRNPPHQNPTRRKVRARTAQRAPSPPSVALRNPHSLLSLSLVHSLSQGEEPWLAASLRPANFLPGLAIGFLLGLLLDLSSSWRPKSSPAPAPAAAPARASSSKRASGTSFASGGEELKMVC
jgi:hypothetical protein